MGVSSTLVSTASLLMKVCFFVFLFFKLMYLVAKETNVSVKSILGKNKNKTEISEMGGGKYRIFYCMSF